MTKKPVLFLDMDGVIADFIQGACDWFDHENPYYKPGALLGDEAWGIEKILGIDEKDFWDPLGYKFWRTLPKTPEADYIIELSKEYFGKRIAFLSSPCHTPGCCDGKIEWAAEHYPDIPLILTKSTREGSPPKELMAYSNAVLVDDHTPNAERFADNGGQAYLFPRPWNKHCLNNVKGPKSYVIGLESFYASVVNCSDKYDEDEEW